MADPRKLGIIKVGTDAMEMENTHLPLHLLLDLLVHHVRNFSGRLCDFHLRPLHRRNRSIAIWLENLIKSSGLASCL